MKLLSLMIACALMGCTIAPVDGQEPTSEQAPAEPGSSEGSGSVQWENECQFIADSTGKTILCGGQNRPGDPFEARKADVVDPYEHIENDEQRGSPVVR